jgi:hypothetical protein
MKKQGGLSIAVFLALTAHHGPHQATPDTSPRHPVSEYRNQAIVHHAKKEKMMNAYQLGFDEIEIQTEAARLGEGFNSLSLSQLSQSSLFPEATIEKSIKEQIDASTAELEFFVAQSSSELATKLNIHAQAAAKAAEVGSAGASADYLDESNFSESRFMFCFRGHAISRRVCLTANPALIESAPGYLSDPEALLGSFGDYYCSELIYGGELIIFVTITAQNSSDKREIAASLEASFSKGGADASASASYKNAFSQATAKSHTTVNLYQVGSINTPPDATFATYLDYAFKYFNEEHTNNLMRAVYRPVTQLPGLQASVRKELNKILKPLWIRRDKFLEWLELYQQAEHPSAGEYYLPTKYYEPVQKDIRACLRSLKTELRSNAGGLDLRDPEAVIREIKKCPPDYYLEKLENQEIQSSARWGGTGGGAFEDPVDDLEGITRIEVTSDHRSGQVVGRLTITALKRNGQIQVTQHGKTATQGFLQPDPRNVVWPVVSLNKGDWIESVEVRADTYVRQIKFGIHRKGQPELEQVALPPHSSQGIYTRMENIILVGFHGRSGEWLDALGIKYIELESSRSKRKPLKEPAL